MQRLQAGLTKEYFLRNDLRKNTTNSNILRYPRTKSYFNRITLFALPSPPSSYYDKRNDTPHHHRTLPLALTLTSLSLPSQALTSFPLSKGQSATNYMKIIAKLSAKATPLSRNGNRTWRVTSDGRERKLGQASRLIGSSMLAKELRIIEHEPE